MKRWIGCLGTAFFAAVMAMMAQEAAPLSNSDDIARLLGGLPPVSDPGIMAVSRTGEWQRYADDMNKWWGGHPLPQIQKVAAWSQSELGSAGSSSAPAIYFFSGPDFLYLQALFPNASTYVLCAKEPVGRLPFSIPIPPQNLTVAFDNLQHSLHTLFNFSYFITEDMKKDLRSTDLTGVAPVLYVLLARTGKTVVHVQPIALARDGSLRNDGSADPQGLRIDFTSGAGGAHQTLYYFSCDLSNSGLKANPGVVRFCARLGMSSGFLKADSYLLHMEEFSTARNFLLDSCRVIVQDDSGIPIRYFSPEKWNVRFYGGYAGPLEIFKQHYQKDLADRYAVSNPKPLDFGMGYRFQPKECALMIAFRKGGQ